MSDKEAFKKEFRELKKSLGLSANSLARLIGSNVCSIYHYMSGVSLPRSPKIMKRAKALNRFFEYLKTNPDYFVDMFDEIDDVDKQV